VIDFARAVYSWKTIWLTTAINALALIASIYAVELRSYSLPIGFTSALLHFVLSGWLWREYVYNGVDFEADYSYAPSGLAKSVYMLVSFIALLGLSLTVTIIDIEQGCLSSLQHELGVCSE
jgi:hypothetical protein